MRMCGGLPSSLAQGNAYTGHCYKDAFVSDFQRCARAAKRKLETLNAAARLDDLFVPPSNRLESLKGDLKGFHSIRINDQWRLIFRWIDGHAHDAEIPDYH